MTLNSEMRRRKEDARRRYALEFAEAPVPGSASWGRAAERLRRMDVYRKALRVMASLDHAVSQARLNILSDRKGLLLPSPGLHKGFFLLEAEGVPLRNRKLAVRPHEMNPFGRKVPYGERLTPPVDMILTGALAVGRDGSLLGDGSGFTDLQAAILAILGWVAPDAVVVAVVDEHRIVTSVPTEETDVWANWIVTPESVLPTAFRGGIGNGNLRWDLLEPRDIKRNDALFHLRKMAASGHETGQ